MKVLIFNPKHENITQQIADRLRGFKHCQLILTFEHLSFECEFARCLSGETIVVFFIDDNNDLSFLEKMSEKFVDVKLVINIPHHANGYYDRILKLCPRMIFTTKMYPQLLPEFVFGIVKEKCKQLI